MIGGIPEKKLAAKMQDKTFDVSAFTENLTENDKQKFDKLVKANRV